LPSEKEKYRSFHLSLDDLFELLNPPEDIDRPLGLKWNLKKYFALFLSKAPKPNKITKILKSCDDFKDKIHGNFEKSNWLWPNLRKKFFRGRTLLLEKRKNKKK